VLQLKIVGYGDVVGLLSCGLIAKSPMIELGACVDRAFYISKNVTGSYVEPFAYDVRYEA
jgi:hypothetical protein